MLIRDFATKLSAPDAIGPSAIRAANNFRQSRALGEKLLGKAGLIEPTGRGRFRLTEDGRRLLSSPSKRIDIKFLGFNGSLRSEF